ncbi:MAG TPA: hypothetical protein VKP14_04190 [Gaiellaceae bacterium]|nr:hypothetical protein [Gaiellaceae bacterium]
MVDPLLRPLPSAPTRKRRLSPLRPAAAALIATAAALHLYLWFDYFHRVHVVGALFLANAAVGALIAVALAANGHALVLLAGAGYSATTLAAFAVSTRWGLFGYHERFWGQWQEAAGAAELAALGLLVAMLAPKLRS